MEMACTQREYATQCVIIATQGNYLVKAKATPIFDWNGQSVRCEKFVDVVDLEWWGESDKGFEAMETLICEDFEEKWETCQGATEALCETDPMTRWYCPASCNKWGWGPAACDGGASCGYVEPEKCPNPDVLEPVGSQYVDCNSVVFTPNA